MAIRVLIRECRTAQVREANECSTLLMRDWALLSSNVRGSGKQKAFFSFTSLTPLQSQLEQQQQQQPQLALLYYWLCLHCRWSEWTQSEDEDLRLTNCACGGIMLSAAAVTVARVTVTAAKCQGLLFNSSSSTSVSIITSSSGSVDASARRCGHKLAQKGFA